MPDLAHWVLPCDAKRILGIVKVARALQVEAVLKRLSSVLETINTNLWRLPSGQLPRKIRSKMRYVSLFCASVTVCV